MAHFAELDEKHIVLRVVVIADDDIEDKNGNESESIGIAFCQRLFGPETIWKQTSYNGTFRKNYAGPGDTFDADRDAFIPPKPYPAWALDEQTCRWQAPVSVPQNNKKYTWNEAQSVWVERIP